jgi:hypothetical protein
MTDKIEHGVSLRERLEEVDLTLAVLRTVASTAWRTGGVER